MKVNFDIYGFLVSDIEALAMELQDILNIHWVCAHSSFTGSYFRYGSLDEENFRLHTNYSEEEQEWMEENYKNFPVLLYVNRTHRAEEIEQKLKSSIHKVFTLLKRTSYDV